MGLTYAELKNTPLGPISFIAGDRGLQRVAFSSLKTLKERSNENVSEPSLQGLKTLADLIQEINAYFFSLRKAFSVQVDWEVLTTFQARVLARTSKIPFAEVMTYSQIARDLGQPGAARAVGRALGANPMPVVIPCHRVVGKSGHLKGYTGGEDKKAFLLALEGHTIEIGRIMDRNV